MRKADLAGHLVPGSKVVLRTRRGANPAHDDIVVAKIISDRFWAPGDETVEFGGLPTYGITDRAKIVDGIIVAVAEVEGGGSYVRPSSLDDIATGVVLTRHQNHGTLVRASAIIDIAVLGGHQSLVEELYSDREDSIVRGGEVTWA